MHFPITALQSPDHSEPPEQRQTRRLRKNDTTHNRISNQTMTEITNTAGPFTGKAKMEIFEL